MFIAALGVLLNLVVVVLNNGMPVGVSPSGQALVLTALDGAQRAFYAPVGFQTILWTLGDVLPLSIRGDWTMLSIGDVLLGVGVAVWIVHIMTASGGEADS
jgi:hypothetical protein